MIAGIRPEAFRLAAPADPPGAVWDGTVDIVEDFGATLLAHVRIEGATLVTPGDAEPDEYAATRLRVRVTLDGIAPIRAGERICLSPDPARLHLFDARTGLALGPTRLQR